MIDKFVLRKPKILKFLNIIKPFIILILIAGFIKLFIFDFYSISSSSMTPSLLKGDKVISFKLSYGIFGVNYKNPTRGDVVALKRPDDYYIKRVIGLENDELAYYKGHFYVNKKLLKKTYSQDLKNYRYIGSDLTIFNENNGNKKYMVSYSNTKRPKDFNKIIKVKKGSFFLVGDNRTNSIDSRKWGSIKRKNILEKIIFIWMSKDPKTNKVRWGRIGFIK
jgi:signal peptidase I